MRGLYRSQEDVSPWTPARSSSDHSLLVARLSADPSISASRPFSEDRNRFFFSPLLGKPPCFILLSAVRSVFCQRPRDSRRHAFDPVVPSSPSAAATFLSGGVFAPNRRNLHNLFCFPAIVSSTSLEGFFRSRSSCQLSSCRFRNSPHKSGCALLVEAS